MHHPIYWENFLPHWLPPVVLHAVVVWAILAVIFFLAVRRLNLVPSGMQNFAEWYISFVRKYSGELIGPTHKQYDPLFLGLFFFIFASNLWGLVPGMVSPTANLNTNLGLALIVFLSTHYWGIRKQGFVPYMKHFTGEVPVWLKPFMFFIELVSHIARPISLTFRLFGNIVAKEILLLILVTLVMQFAGANEFVGKLLIVFPVILFPLIVVLGAFVCFIQAFVFMLLAQVYIAGAVASEHDGEGVEGHAH
ncbi:MAG: F0F1 ATP synthase subunit A [Candidatus Brocadiia bacterium]